MMTLEQVRGALRDRRIEIVSQETGLSVGTIRQIRDSEDANPRYATLQALITYLEGRK